MTALTYPAVASAAKKGAHALSQNTVLWPVQLVEQQQRKINAKAKTRAFYYLNFPTKILIFEFYGFFMIFTT